MPTIHVFDGDPVHCKATLKGQKFKDVKKVEFVFNEAGKEVARAPATLDKSGSATGTWDKAKGPDKPALVRKLRYHVEFDGKKLANQPEEIDVWARELHVTAQHKDGKPFEAAHARIEHTSEKTGKTNKGIVQATDASGKIVWTIPEPGPVKVSWDPPYFLLDKKWVKNTGIEWEAKIEKIAPVVLQWPPPGKHRQWVNLTDASKPEEGPTLKVKVAPGKLGPIEKGKKIHLKAEYGKENSDRTPMTGGKKKGETLTLEKEPDATGNAEFDVPVGYAGGDTITISVGSTDECKDSKVVVTTWRKLYYELMAPDAMKPRLEENPAKVLDLPKTTRAWFKARLAKAYVVYELKAFHPMDDAKVSKFLHDGSYLGKKPGQYYVLGDPAFRTPPSPYAFGVDDKRTIFVRCCDVSADGNPAADMEVYVSKVETTSACAEIYKVNPNDGSKSVFDVTWEAFVDPAATPTHPGVAGGAAKSGNLPDDAIELITKNKFKIKLSGDAAALVGPPNASTCNIKVKWKWVTADPYNGAAVGKLQIMNLGRPLRPVAATICHELGHTMGMTSLEKATDDTYKASDGISKGDNSLFQNKPPDGLDYQKPVPDGTAYDGHGHQGPHCAAGLTKKQKELHSYGGQKGKCIMFGEGGNETYPSRDSYCDDCAKYIKARNITDVSASWTGRGNKADYEGRG